MASPLWNAIYGHYSTLNAHCRRIIGSVDRRFWIDNWVGESILGPLPVDAYHTIATRLDMISDLWHMIPYDLHTSISQIFVTPEHPDRLVFAPNEHGNFSTKAYITLSRRGGAARLWARWIWQHSYHVISQLFYGKWFGTLCQWMNALNRGMFTWCPDVTVERLPKSPLYISSSTHRLRVRFGSDLHTYYNSKMSTDLFSRF